MNIQEALKETGKAKLPTWHDGAYVYVKNDLIFLKGMGGYDKPYSSKVMLAGDWQPHHEVKEIRPQKAGELWSIRDTLIFTYEDVYGDPLQLKFIYADGSGQNYISGHANGQIIHNKNGWTLIYSPDEEVMKKIKGLKDDEKINGDSFEYAKNIAIALHRRCYSEDSPHWQPLETLYGVLSQIDNMSTGMDKLIEDDSVERIEIDAKATDITGCSTTYSFTLPDGYAVRIEREKTFLEIPKDAT